MNQKRQESVMLKIKSKVVKHLRIDLTMKYPIKRAENLPSLHDQVQCVANKRRTFRYVINLLYAVGACIWVTLLLDFWRGRVDADWNGLFGHTGFSIILAVTINMCSVLMLVSMKYKGAMSAPSDIFDGITDIRSIGEMINILRLLKPRDINFSNLIIANLTTLLPHLQTSDACFLDKNQREYLYRMLLNPIGPANKPFINSILQAIERIGDRQALPYVEKLASGQRKTTQNRQIQEAAQECLQRLRERFAEQDSSQTLMRPASPFAVPSEVLLRPATTASETDPKQLLRPTAQD